MMTRSELVAMGFDKDLVDSLESGDTLEFSPDRIARYSRGEQPNSMGSQDQSMEVVEVYECYIKVDYNNDGIAELRRIVYASNEILEDEECDYIPFHSLCPNGQRTIPVYLVPSQTRFLQVFGNNNCILSCGIMSGNLNGLKVSNLQFIFCGGGIYGSD